MNKFAIFNPEFNNNHTQDALRNGEGGQEDEFSPAEGKSGVHFKSQCLAVVDTGYGNRGLRTKIHASYTI